MTEFEQEAIILIRNYLNKDTLTDDYIQANFSLAIKRLASRIEELDDIPNGISETKKGEESIIYSTKNIISEDIKRLLPKPYLKFF
ncbi:hypothetical protein [Clostridium beijerinckii]|uniref:Phage gp6-like head-tail connector protein n=1 Tax=Clostridium beijerinckii TaxID=1520 RepID=A0A1S9N9J5_CLOBE|nr:hypothetical protein [Clostridium beijerinckii]OOP74152.1 hypothetical protein CBEIBR21_06540 [Clostridium beijerinckii]